jgi:hypothetical protein
VKFLSNDNMGEIFVPCTFLSTHLSETNLFIMVLVVTFRYLLIFCMGHVL